MQTKLTSTTKTAKAPRAHEMPSPAVPRTLIAAATRNNDASTDEPGSTRPLPPPGKSPSAPRQPSKSAIVLKLLGRAKGATIAEIVEPTGWQPHSTRAYLSGLRKKCHTVVREQRRSGETSYRIGGAASPADTADVAPAIEAPIPAVSDAIEANDGGAGTAGAAALVDAEADAATTPEVAA